MTIRKRHVISTLLGILIRSPKRGWMLALLVLIASVMVAEISLSVRGIQYTGSIMDALNERADVRFYAALRGFIWVMLATTGCVVLHSYLQQRLLMESRTELVQVWLARWFRDDTMYRLERDQALDNPDQRIAEDLRLFVEKILTLGLGLFSALLGIGAYAGILWQQGGALDIDMGGSTWSIPGYMFWSALLFACFTTWLSRWIATPLIGLNMKQQQVEADFRFSMIQVREHAEQIALYGGGQVEFHRLTRRFDWVRRNWWQLIFYEMRWQMVLSATGGLSSSAIYMLVGGKVLTGVMTVGAMTTLGGAFGSVLLKLSWFASSWAQIVQWIAVTERLKQMDIALNQSDRAGIGVGKKSVKVIKVASLTLALPDGKVLTTINKLVLQQASAGWCAVPLVWGKVPCCARLPGFGRMAAVRWRSLRAACFSCRKRATCRGIHSRWRWLIRTRPMRSTMRRAVRH